jgi:nitronate monooxygenase
MRTVDPAQLEAALERFAVLPPDQSEFLLPLDGRSRSGTRAALAAGARSVYREFGVEPPQHTTAGARRPIDEATVDLLKLYRPRIVSFH